MCVGAVVNLGHIRVCSGLPCSCPHHSGVALKSVVPNGGADVIYLQRDAQICQHFGCCNSNTVCRVILLALAGDHDFIGSGGIGELACCLVPGEACCLEVADSGLSCGCILLFIAHCGGVDRVAVHIHGVGGAVAFVSRLRCCPGGVGDGVLDDCCAVAVIGIDHGVTVDGEEGHKALSQCAGCVGTRFAVNVDEVGVDAEVAVSAVVNEVGSQGVADQLIIGVCILDGSNGVAVDGRGGDVIGAGDDAGDIVAVNAFLHKHNLGDRLTLEVIGVGLEGDNTLVVAVKHVCAAAYGNGGLVLDDAQIALGEAEAVVVVVVEGLITVVVQRSNGEGHVIDCFSVKLSHVHGHGVVARALNACNVCSAAAGGDTDGVCCVVFHQVKEAGACRLGVGEGDKVAFVGFHHVGKEVSRGGVFRKLEAPVCSACCDGILSLVVACTLAIVYDFLCESCTGLIDVCPECRLSVGIPVGKVFIVAAGRDKQAGKRLHAGAILFHSFNRESIKCSSSVIGRVTLHIDAKNNIVNIGRSAVREDYVITHGEIVVNGAVLILHNLNVTHAVIGIVGAVVGSRLAFNAVLDNRAATVSCKERSLS